MRLLRKLLAALVFVGLLVVGWRLAHDNAQTVQVRYVVGSSPELALWKALLAASGVGALLCAGPLGFAWARARLEPRRYRKLLRRRDRGLQDLRGNDAEPAESGPEGVGQGVNRA